MQLWLMAILGAITAGCAAPKSGSADAAALYEAAAANDTNTISVLLAKGVAVDSRLPGLGPNWHKQAIHAAALHRRMEATMLLLEHGADINARDPNTGKTPLDMSFMGYTTENERPDAYTQTLIAKGGKAFFSDSPCKQGTEWALAIHAEHQGNIAEAVKRYEEAAKRYAGAARGIRTSVGFVSFWGAVEPGARETLDSVSAKALARGDIATYNQAQAALSKSPAGNKSEPIALALDRARAERYDGYARECAASVTALRVKSR